MQGGPRNIPIFPYLIKLRLWSSYLIFFYVLCFDQDRYTKFQQIRTFTIAKYFGLFHQLIWRSCIKIAGFFNAYKCKTYLPLFYNVWNSTSDVSSWNPDRELSSSLLRILLARRQDFLQYSDVDITIT